MAKTLLDWAAIVRVSQSGGVPLGTVELDKLAAALLAVVDSLDGLSTQEQVNRLSAQFGVWVDHKYDGLPANWINPLGDIGDKKLRLVKPDGKLAIWYEWIHSEAVGRQWGVKGSPGSRYNVLTADEALTDVRELIERDHFKHMIVDA